MKTTRTMPGIEPLGASFRDTSGFLFRHSGILYRQINPIYKEHYDHLMGSGLFDRLLKAGLVISHREIDPAIFGHPPAYKIIQPELVPFISYPYEWSFSQLKDAALATLAIQKRALKHGMLLKDASAYNIQFVHGRPILIDTLSFEIYQEGQPWVAYRQFCQHFLAPLALMAYADVRLGQLTRIHIDGIPMDLASHLLPKRTYLNFGLLSHIHLHSRAQKNYATRHDKRIKVEDLSVGGPIPKSVGRKMSWQSLIALVSHLEATVRSFAWKPEWTQWGNYYEFTNYSKKAVESKIQVLTGWMDALKPQIVWDLGANTGAYSRLASTSGAFTVAFDMDPTAVELNYLRAKEENDRNLLPLMIDLSNPSPPLGWANRERDSLTARAPADVILALALVHHLAISNNVPLRHIAEFFSGLAKWLVIEFVPKTDSQVKLMLASRRDIFTDYTAEGFRAAFDTCYREHASSPINDSERQLLLLERR